jgi:hypothetical protein
MAESDSFIIKYDGQALADHQIDIQDIAPALLGLADLLQEANRVVNGENTSLSVKVKTGVISPGSVIVDIYCEYVSHPDLLAIAVEKLSSPEAIAIGTLSGILSFLGITPGAMFGGLISFLLKSKNKTIKSVEKEQTKAVVTFSDGSKADTNEKVLDLLNNYKIRKSLAQVIATPLARPGIDDVEFKKAATTKEGVKVFKSDAAYFGVPEGEEFVVSDNTVEIWVNIEGMFFSERNKWTFSDGRTRFTAPLHDDAFLSNIQKGNEVFKAGDRLLVKMKIVQKQKFGFDMRVTHEILNVIEHKHLMTQMNLPLENQ